MKKTILLLVLLVGINAARSQSTADQIAYAKSHPDDAVAAFGIGLNYFFGKPDVQADLETAVYWFQKAAQKEHGAALAMLSQCYYAGMGCSKDMEMSFIMAHRGATRGNVECEIMLSRLYREGAGVDKNENQAFYWATKSAENNNMEGLYILANLYDIGVGCAINHSKALELLHLAEKERMADGGFSNVAFMYSGDTEWIIALHYLNGEGCPKDVYKGVEYLFKADVLDNKKANQYIGYLLFSEEAEDSAAFACWLHLAQIDETDLSTRQKTHQKYQMGEICCC